jgi:hypothetical protein
MLKHVYKLRHRFLSEIPEFRMTYNAEKLTKATPLRKKSMHCVATFISLLDSYCIADSNAALTPYPVST